MNILVTGGAGFIGSHIVDSYINAGHRVYSIDDLSSGQKSRINPKAIFKKINVTNNKKIREFFSRNKIDVVNHLAAQIDVRRSIQDPQTDAEVNIFGILNLLECCKEFKVKKFIFSSSGGTIYGECRRPAKEGDPEIPLVPYGVAKLASEKYIQTYSELFGLNYTIFRYSNVYGPRQDPHGEAGVVAIFSNQILNQEKSIIFGSGKQTRDFVYVKDVAHVNLIALKDANKKVLNIGTQKETTVLELYKTMASIESFNKPPIFKAPRKGELQQSVLNIERLKEELKWVPRYSLREGLTETLNFFKTK